MKPILCQLIAVALIFLATPIRAEQDPLFKGNSPFRLGEGFGKPTNCSSLGNWVNKVPDDFTGNSSRDSPGSEPDDGLENDPRRISMVIDGKIVESHWDGALAYLIMCQSGGIQVMCVTYARKRVSDEIVMFAGGYNRYGETQVVLDPCLVYPAGSDVPDTVDN